MAPRDELVHDLAELIDEIESFDLRLPEDSAILGLAASFVDPITDLVTAGLEILRRVESIYDDEEPEADLLEPHSLWDIGLLISAEMAERELLDLAFFARSDLRACLEELATATSQRNLVVLASTCERTVQRLKKALVSIESAAVEFEGGEPPHRLLADLQVSLQVRQLYARLRRELHDPELDSHSLEERLRRIMRRLVALRELRIYPFLRFDDRVELRRLLRRILGWLNATERKPVEGELLWKDLVSFLELLSYINQREEVVEHDRSVVARAHDTLALAATKGQEPPAQLLFELDGLLGLDQDLDRLILSRPPPPAEGWVRPLSRLADRLGTESSGEGPTATDIEHRL